MKKKLILMLILILIGLYMPNVIAANIEGCQEILPGIIIDEKIPNTVHTIILLIQIVVPILLVIFGMLDLFKGITAQKEDEIKKGQQIFIKRLISAAIIFFVVVIVKLLISFVADDSGELFNCVDCFLNGADKCKTVNKENDKNYENGEVVYYNVTTGKSCSESEAISTTGTKSGCMKFYAYNDNGGDTINLLLDHNTTAKVVWNSSGKNVSGPKELLNALYEDTKNWKGTEIQKNYTMDQTKSTSGAKYTIDYTGYKARLITAEEIAQIVEADIYTALNWKEESQTDWFNFGGKKTYNWLVERTSCCDGCQKDSSTFGYWTASSTSLNSITSWFVTCNGDLHYNCTVDLSCSYGVRPVITVLKSKLS